MPYVWTSGGYTFTFTEHVDSTAPGEESFADDDSRATRVLLFDYGSKVSATRATLGFANKQTAGGGTFISRAIPMPYNDYASVYSDDASLTGPQPYLWATRVNTKGMGKPTNGNMVGTNALGGPFASTVNAMYNTAMMTVLYESVPWTVLTDTQMQTLGYIDSNGNPDEASLGRYVTIEPAPSSLYLSVPKGCMQIVGLGVDPVTVGISPGKIVGQADIVITWRRVPGNLIPSAFVNQGLGGSPAAIEKTIGKVNFGNFPPTGPYANCYTSGTLLLIGVRLRRIRSALGGTIWDIEYHLQYQSTIQNYVPYISGGLFTWVELSSDGAAYGPATLTNGKHIYDAVSFTPLFRGVP